MPVAFTPMPKIPRLLRDCIITEKIDGTNASIHVCGDGTVQAGSRTRWVTPEDDNFGFARWVKEHENVLREHLGPGLHFGEWFGKGIQRNYGLPERRFALFNTARWHWLREKTTPQDHPLRQARVTCVPKLFEGIFQSGAVLDFLDMLKEQGSLAVPGWMKPEGVVIWHDAARQLFKVTLDGDGHKGRS